jgi:glucuronokinase
VGLAGSSAIVIAVLRALQRHARLPPLPPDELASLALSVEVDELGYAAGLQDRVVQAYGRPMLMRFDPDRSRLVSGLAAGSYHELREPLPGWLTVAARPTESEPSQVVHRSLRERHERGEEPVVAAMAELAATAEAAASVIRIGDVAALGRAMDRSYDIRRSIMDIRPGQAEMIDTARRAGAWANFAGSGGAVSVLAPDEATSRDASARLEAIGCDIIDLVDIVRRGPASP